MVDPWLKAVNYGELRVQLCGMLTWVKCITVHQYFALNYTVFRQDTVRHVCFAWRYIVLHHIAVHCITILYIALPYPALHYIRYIHHTTSPSFCHFTAERHIARQYFTVLSSTVGYNE